MTPRMRTTRALVISRYFPQDPQMVHGVFQRLGTQIEALGRVADRVDCLFLVARKQKYSPQELAAHRERLSRLWSTDVNLTVAPVAEVPKRRSRWLEFGVGIFDYYRQPIICEANNPEAREAVAAALRSGPDLVHVHRLSAMSILMQLKYDAKGIPLFFDLDDIEHVAATLRLVRSPQWLGEQLKLLHIPRLLFAEMQAIRLSQRTFICSHSDHRYLQRLVGEKHLAVVPNSSPIPPGDTHDRSEAVVLFVGSMFYEPNALAADTLVRDIWPRVLAQMPDARLVIAGIHPELIPAFASAPPGVTFTGFVTDLSELYATARVVCCPILYGGGTRIKIIEAAAYGRPVVATSLAARGLAFQKGSEILISDNFAQLAQECVRLLQNPHEARELGVAARERARSTYDRSVILQQLEKIFAGGLGQRQ